MNTKVTIALSIGVGLIVPPILVIIAFLVGSVSGGTSADMQLLSALIFISLFSGLGMILLGLEVVELRSFVEEGFKLLKENAKKEEE